MTATPNDYSPMRKCRCGKLSWVEGTERPDKHHGEAACYSTHSKYEPPPTHYSTGAGIDPWAVWDAFDLDRYTANAVKYLLRAGKKDIAPRLDDLVKARNYIEKAIEIEKSKNGKD